jgi:hypothetical protein
MTLAEEPKKEPSEENSVPENEPDYGWDDKNWTVPSQSQYPHWYANNSDYPADERRYWRHQVWALWSSVGIAVATLLFVVLGAYTAFCAFKETQRQANAAVDANKIYRATLEASNRAWLGPMSVDFLKPIDADDGPLVIATYQNVGRFPALNSKTTLSLTSIELDKKITGPHVWPESKQWPAVDIELRTSCLLNQSIMGGATIYPNASNIGSNAVAGPTIPIDKTGIQAGTHLLIARGCLVYQTFEETHRTIFCQFATNVRNGKWEWLSCPVGNLAQ